MTIHTDHPFAEPEERRDPARRLRGRLGGAVTLWTAGDGPDRAGLTVSSVMVAHGPTHLVLALIDPDSDLLTVLRESGRAVVQLLSWPDRQLAEAFAGTAPAPGGPFRQAPFEPTPYGPRLSTATTWADVSLAGEREVGWSVEVSASIDAATVGNDQQPLLHRRGRFLALPDH
ncbi:MAG TPA: flavin reductase [Nocardioides sp.]|nr:flavin reductase [Nocardioides sp.]